MTRSGKEENKVCLSNSSPKSVKLRYYKSEGRSEGMTDKELVKLVTEEVPKHFPQFDIEHDATLLDVIRFVIYDVLNKHNLASISSWIDGQRIVEISIMDIKKHFE